MRTSSAQEIEESTDQLIHDLKTVVDDGEELLRAAAQDLSDRSLAAREKLAAALEVAKDTSRRLEERATAGVAATREVIREHPYRALGVAFGVGMLLGFLMNRR